MNQQNKKFKAWINETVKLPEYIDELSSSGILTMKYLIQSIDVEDKNSLNKLIKFYSDDHLNIFWNKIQEYLHPSIPSESSNDNKITLQ